MSEQKQLGSLQSISLRQWVPAKKLPFDANGLLSTAIAFKHSIIIPKFVPYPIYIKTTKRDYTKKGQFGKIYL